MTHILIRTMTAVAAVAVVCTATAAEPLVLNRRSSNSDFRGAIVFCAREGVPGHAFVVLGEENEKKQASTIEAFGFYPKKGVGIFGPVPGRVADEIVEKRSLAVGECRVIVQVESDPFQRVNGIRQRWALSKDYRLVQSDCVSFVDEVATEIGLATPRRREALTPVSFINSLESLNRPAAGSRK